MRAYNFHSPGCRSLQVPDMDKRNTMNLLLAGGVALPVGALAVPYALFFVPVR